MIRPAMGAAGGVCLLHSPGLLFQGWCLLNGLDLEYSGQQVTPGKGGGGGSQGWPSQLTERSQRIAIARWIYASEEIERREEAAIEKGC